MDRGGDITYHGPGQLVGYPVVGLGDAPDLVAYVRALEAALIDAAGAYGLHARTERGKTGVWVDLPGGRSTGAHRAAKLAAIGVRVSRGVSTHGFALNVTTDLSAFGRMIACGFAHEVASLERLGVTADVSAVGRECAEALARRLGREILWDAAVAEPDDFEIPDDAPVRAARDLIESLDREELAAS